MLAARSAAKSVTAESEWTSPLPGNDDDDFQDDAPSSAKCRRQPKETRKSLSHDFDSVASPRDCEHEDAETEQEEEQVEEKRIRLITEWKRISSFDTSVYTTDQITHECTEIAKARLRAAGIDKLPATHKSKPTDLGNWKMKEPTITEKGACITNYYRCPLAHRTGCPHKLRVQHYAGVVHIEATEGHEGWQHMDKNNKILSWRQVNAIAAAVQTAPNQAPASIRRNLQNFDSPSKKVTPDLLPAVRRLVKNVRESITRVNLAGVEVDGSYGSLTQLCEAIKFRELIKRHNDPDNDYHIDMFETVCIGHDIEAETNVIFIALTNIWMLCEIARIKNSGWALQIQGDGTFKICAEAVCLLGLGVNRVGAHFHPVALLVVPDGTETEDAWTQLWKCIRHAIHRLFLKLELCALATCDMCAMLRRIREEEAWSSVLKDIEFYQRYRIKVDYGCGDNNWPWANFCHNQLLLSTGVCSTHATGNVGTYFINVYIF